MGHTFITHCKDYMHVVQFLTFMGVKGCKFKSSCLHSKYFMARVAFLVLELYFYKDNWHLNGDGNIS